ncbi:DUF1501 domain-containing protein [Vulcaniibacterium thermophilum]|uniref:DUF1501 domain-containing protein n=1 Tax=Vulcaniibacterium thermophilum TaxID=1169913 RepID=A0A919D9M5_9GAMM|nr:DUF1501 domain-containing protein [Vulcaniibacterium thermophilum]GHE27409.1 hypothetical protein GCM10007167_06030 [Vulcaniibacterium thermophilum]
MSTLSESRRRFLQGCCATAALGAVGPTLLFTRDARAASNSYDTLVFVFLRGGLDGLNFVVPLSGADRGFYEQARPNLMIATSGTYGALPLTLAGGSATGFGLHPSATGLRDIWNAGQLAIVHACGLTTTITRSHFDAQLAIDLGTVGQGGGVGWLARAMNTQPGLDAGDTMPALAVNSRQPASLNGTTQALTLSRPGEFAVDSTAYAWRIKRPDSPAGLLGVQDLLPTLWGGPTGLESAGGRANQALAVVARQTYQPLPAGWPTGTFAEQLWTVAQSIQFDLGLRYATVDLGGWDTHDGQGTAGSGYHYYQNKIAELSAALAAFHNALAASGHLGRVTVVVPSEFGRRVRQNANNGTDHGYGNPVLVLGGAVNGRRFFGTWPGLDPDLLSATYGDLPVTTDHRRVLSELLIRRMGNPHLSAIFPGYGGYSPLGLVQGADQAPRSLPVASGLPAATGRQWHHQPRLRPARGRREP